VHSTLIYISCRTSTLVSRVIMKAPGKTLMLIIWCKVELRAWLVVKLDVVERQFLRKWINSGFVILK
jgi:hypothetical protein